MLAIHISARHSCDYTALVVWLGLGTQTTQSMLEKVLFLHKELALVSTNTAENALSAFFKKSWRCRASKCWNGVLNSGHHHLQIWHVTNVSMVHSLWMYQWFAEKMNRQHFILGTGKEKRLSFLCHAKKTQQRQTHLGELQESIRWVKWTKKQVITKLYIRHDLFRHITTMSKPSCVISYAAQRYLARTGCN